MTSARDSEKRGQTPPVSLARELGGIVFGQLRDALVQRAAMAKRPSTDAATVEEPPVVAQLMIEIRSDGGRTIARGALNDLRGGESAQLRAEGRTPAELMVSLATSLLELPTAVFNRTWRAASGQDELPKDAAVSARVTSSESKNSEHD